MNTRSATNRREMTSQEKRDPSKLHPRTAPASVETTRSPLPRPPRGGMFSTSPTEIIRPYSPGDQASSKATCQVSALPDPI